MKAADRRPEDALMAELVDALVSNTNGASRAGSSPAQGTGGLERYRSGPSYFLRLLSSLFMAGVLENLTVYSYLLFFRSTSEILPARPRNALKYDFIKLNTLNKCRNRTLSLKKYSLALDNRKISINFAPFLIAKNCFIILIY